LTCPVLSPHTCIHNIFVLTSTKLQYSAMVFLSETVHGVDPIPSGHREMFTNELWPLLDVAFPMNRPDEDDFEVYNDWINDAIEADENPLSVPYPELRETDAWLAERNRVRQNDVDYENEFEEDEDPRDDDDDEYDGADYEDEPDSTHDSFQ